jgi:hypothetical protein
MIDEQVKLELSAFEKHLEEMEDYAIDQSKEIEKLFKEPAMLFAQIYEDNDQEAAVRVYSEEVSSILNNVCEKYKEMGGLVDCMLNFKQKIDESYFRSLYYRTRTVESFFPALIRHSLEHSLWITRLIKKRAVKEIKQAQEKLCGML